MPTEACAHRRGVQAVGCSRHKLGAGVGEQLLKRALTYLWHKYVHTLHASADFASSRLPHFCIKSLVSGTLRGPVEHQGPALASPRAPADHPSAPEGSTAGQPCNRLKGLTSPSAGCSRPRPGAALRRGTWPQCWPSARASAHSSSVSGRTASSGSDTASPCRRKNLNYTVLRPNT